MLHESHEVPIHDRRENKNGPCEKEPFYRASSTLLSRLAEAVDGFRIGEPVCYVGRYWYDADDSGHRLYGPFRSCEEAAAFRKANGLDEKEFGIFGPFYTRAPGRRVGGAAPAPRVVKEVLVRFEDGGECRLDGEEYDSVFWSASAVDKFVLPYYISIGSLEEGNVLTDRAAGAYMLAHRPGSVWVLDGGSTVLDADSRTRSGFGVGMYAFRPAGDGTTFKADLVSGAADR